MLLVCRNIRVVERWRGPERMMRKNRSYTPDWMCLTWRRHRSGTRSLVVSRGGDVSWTDAFVHTGRSGCCLQVCAPLVQGTTCVRGGHSIISNTNFQKAIPEFRLRRDLLLPIIIDSTRTRSTRDYILALYFFGYYSILDKISLSALLSVILLLS
jgi:hypothetical protein